MHTESVFLFLSVLEGYLIGSVSVSILLIRRLYHADIRTEGSGNAGATNVARVFGFKPGIITFLGDFIKCALSMWLGQQLAGAAGWALAGAACLIGHCFPLYFGFRGGKAVSTGAAVAFLIDWRLFLLLLTVFAIVVAATRIVSVSSIAAGIVLAAASPFFAQGKEGIALAVFTGVLVLFMHRGNIRRLLNGTEGKFTPGGKK